MDLVCAVYLVTIGIKQSWPFLIRLDCLMAIHTNIHGRYCRMPAFPRVAVAVKAAYLVDTCVYFMRVVDWLSRLVCLLTSETDGTLRDEVATNYEQDDGNKCDIDFVL